MVGQQERGHECVGLLPDGAHRLQVGQQAFDLPRLCPLLDAGLPQPGEVVGAHVDKLNVGKDAVAGSEDDGGRRRGEERGQAVEAQCHAAQVGQGPVGPEDPGVDQDDAGCVQAAGGQHVAAPEDDKEEVLPPGPLGPGATRGSDAPLDSDKVCEEGLHSRSGMRKCRRRAPFCSNNSSRNSNSSGNSNSNGSDTASNLCISSMTQLMAPIISPQKTTELKMAKSRRSMPSLSEMAASLVQPSSRHPFR